ncbi:tyrosine-type recombinase/integrase [Corynebacterium callunae]|uniref:tyrosine-type recombinase/integrase n=1 Tax=Corynebacterium callunae TaxID=1721 RepID=UPI003982A317
MAGKRRTRRAFGTVRAKGKRFYAEYTGPDGAQHTPGHSFASRTDADGWLATERRLIDLETWSPPAVRKDKAEQDTTTVGQWLEQYHVNLEHRPKPPRLSTMQNYRRVTTNRITNPLSPGDVMLDITRLASLPLVKLTKGDVYRWWDGVQRAYPDAHTINQQAFKRLRAACEEATRREMIPTNPVDVPEAGKRVQTKEKYLPEDGELHAILEAMPAQYRVLTSLMLFHGLHIGEALALEQRHVQVEYLPAPWMPRVVVRVEQNAQRLGGDDGRTFMFIQPPKSDAGYREVPIMASHVPLFLEHHALHLPGAPTLVETWQGPRRVSLLTAMRTGGLMMDTSYRSVLNRAKERAGVSMEIDPHCGRNWLITRLAEQGAHLKEIGRLLGQEDVATILDVYMKVRTGRTATLMEKVNSTLEVTK